MVDCHFAVFIILRTGFICPAVHSLFQFFISKSNLHYFCIIAPKCVTSDGAHLCGLSPWRHSSKETLQRGVGDTVPNLIAPGVQPQTFRTDVNALATELTGQFALICLCIRAEKHIDTALTVAFGRWFARNSCRFCFHFFDL